MTAMDSGLLLLRVMIGLLMAGHGAQKLFGWSGGPGLGGLTGYLRSLGFRPAAFWAFTGALGEFGGGLLLALGLFTPLAASLIISSMLVAAFSMHWRNGLWITNGGYEYTLTTGVVAAALGLTGPGAVSLDAALGLHFPVAVFLLAAVGGAAVAVAALTTRSVPAPAQADGRQAAA
ncbi:MAG: DoxX family protein [Chloroflexi bacterium]|nr:DoxX family protein [Chloroflexota bacterium]